MVRVIVTVLVLLIILGYAAMFLSWNQEAVTVTGCKWGAQGYVEDVPLGALILGGLLAGAILMAGFSLGAYQSQKSQCATAQAKVALAKKKLDELVAKVKQQREKIAQLEKAGAAPAAPAAERVGAACPAEAEEDEEEI
jgi:uncharacterized integral membrane protein